MNEYLRVGLITFFVSLVLTGVVFTHSLFSLEIDSNTPITIAIVYPSIIISIMLATIIMIAKRYIKLRAFNCFTRGFIAGGLVFFVLTYLFMPTFPFFGSLFYDLLYLPGLLVTYIIIKPLVALITPLPTAINDNPFVVWPTVMFSIIFYTLAGAFINIWRYKRRGQA